VVARKTFEGNKKAPVVIWIHGGGYVEGNKDSLFDPSGLVVRSLEDGSEGIVFVAINYRVGLSFLFLAPLFFPFPSFLATAS
jgi:carboxylesterase type B